VGLGLNPRVSISTDFSRLKNKKRRDAAKRHLVTFPATFKNMKGRDPVRRDFLGKKVTSLVEIARIHQKGFLSHNEKETFPLNKRRNQDR